MVLRKACQHEPEMELRTDTRGQARWEATETADPRIKCTIVNAGSSRSADGVRTSVF